MQVRAGRAAAIALVALTACGGGGAGSPDASMDAGDASHHGYVVASISEPTQAGDGQADGADLDGDGLIDNAFGAIGYAVTSAAGTTSDPEARLTAAVQAGDVILLADVTATDLGTATDVGVRMYLGDHPQPAPCTDPAMPSTCGQHLDGSGSFDVAAGSPTDLTVGSIVDGRLGVGEGQALVALSLCDSPPFVLELTGARVIADHIDGSTITGGIIAGGIPQAQVDGVMLPALQTGVAADLARDCTGSSPPGCGCQANTAGAVWIDQFDGNHDCQVTAAEIGDSPLLRTLLAPDIDINGKLYLSAGVRFTAVGAAFTAP